MKEAKALLESKGEKLECFTSRMCLSLRVKIGPTQAHVTYDFIDDKFTGAMLVFAPAQYETLRTIFADRYGPPSSIRDEELKPRAGAAYANEVAVWTGERVVIRIQRYSSKITEGSVTIVLKEALDKRREETEKAIKKGKEDL
jgi:hypothetical protein